MLIYVHLGPDEISCLIEGRHQIRVGENMGEVVDEKVGVGRSP